uniref:3'-5' exonuclease n=1 Tax=Rhizophora mucronata TaxID=61149 RepID=A0A2P2KCL7_RHIMU
MSFLLLDQRISNLCVKNIVQLNPKLKIQCLAITFAIVNNFCYMTRFKCRLTHVHYCFSTLNHINQVYSIRKCKLHNTETSMATQVDALTIKTDNQRPFRRGVKEFSRELRSIGDYMDWHRRRLRKYWV